MPPEIAIAGRRIGSMHPTYFIADIGANHDGDLARAKELIHLVAAAGGDAAKFQNFSAPSIVSDRGFRTLGSQLSHQSAWPKPVYDVYADASLDVSWTAELRAACDEAGIHYLTSPYSPDLADAVEPWVVAYKIGSGDITWLELLDHVAGKGKPVILATGASTMDEVERAVSQIRRSTSELALLQCNTNYTASRANLLHVNLSVLTEYARRFPELVLGLSDHTHGDTAVLGAVALGARIVEKHFTDDRSRVGPDHAFAMTPQDWRDMVERTRDLEAALGDGVKRIEENEQETAVVQRRAVRAAHAIGSGSTLTGADVMPLRPCPADAIGAADIDRVVGRVTVRDLAEGEELRWSDLR